MSSQETPNWLDDWARSTYQLFEGNVLEAFQPIDFFHFFPLFYDRLFEKIDQVLTLAESQGITNEELYAQLPPPSSIRAVMTKLICVLPSIKTDPVIIRRVIDFLHNGLLARTADDPYAFAKNLAHNENEVQQIVASIDFQPANPEISRALGRLFTAATSLVHGLYNDVSTDNGIDIYGPYELPIPDGEPDVLLIRHFPDLKVSPIWQGKHTFPISELMIYQRYHPIHIDIATVGVHTVIHGNPIEALKEYIVIADGKVLSETEIKQIVDQAAAAAETIYRDIRAMNFETLKQLIVNQEFYQLRDLFDAVDLSWKPGEEIMSQVKNKQLLIDDIPIDRPLTYDEYCDKLGINKLKEIYTSHKL